MTKTNQIAAHNRFSLKHRPAPRMMLTYRKKTTVSLFFSTLPFTVETQEGAIPITEESQGWEGGYYVAYPSDGSQPYAISPKFVRDNYEVDR